MEMVREEDPGALDYLNALPAGQMVAKIRAGSTPWEPRILAWDVQKWWWNQSRVPAGSPEGGEFGEGGGGSGGGATQPEEGATKDWAPHMTAEQAARWQEENGAKTLTGPLYHGTESWRAARIAEGGFEPKQPAANAQIYGKGTYLTDSQNLAFWKYANGNKEGLLETRVALSNPATLGQTREVLQSVREKYGDSRRDLPSLIRQEAENRGFDALRVEYYEPVMGRNAGAATNLIVFDKQKITTIDK